MDAPRVVTMNIGSTLWISSEEESMNSEANPNAQMPAGRVRHDPFAAVGGMCFFNGVAPGGAIVSHEAGVTMLPGRRL
jgi:hypothetical protein